MRKVEEALLAEGIRGFSVSKVKGHGEERAFIELNLVTHVKFDIFARDDQVETIVRTIQEACWTGCAGDGVIAVMPLEDFVKIRTRQRGEGAMG